MTRTKTWGLVLVAMMVGCNAGSAEPLPPIDDSWEVGAIEGELFEVVGGARELVRARIEVANHDETVGIAFRDSIDDRPRIRLFVDHEHLRKGEHTADVSSRTPDRIPPDVFARPEAQATEVQLEVTTLGQNEVNRSLIIEFRATFPQVIGAPVYEGWVELGAYQPGDPPPPRERFGEGTFCFLYC